MVRNYRRRGFFQTSLAIGFFLCVLILSSKSVQAQELDFNRSKTVTISDQESYAATQKYVWVKYKAPADGYISLKASYASIENTYSAGEWTLYNSSKMLPLSEKNIVYNTKQSDSSYWHASTFGVKKKNVYYLRVRAYNGVKVTCSFKKISEKAGAKRLNAVNLKKGKTKTGLMFADDNKVDWYKIELTQKKKLYMYFKVRSEGRFRISLYSALGRGLCYNSFEYTKKEQKITISQRNQKTGKISAIDAGTYYVKIEPANSTSSGYYTLRWK